MIPHKDSTATAVLVQLLTLPSNFKKKKIILKQVPLIKENSFKEYIQAKRLSYKPVKIRQLPLRKLEMYVYIGRTLRKHLYTNGELVWENI